MPFGSDDRAVAIQVGAIVLFAFVIIAITAYQASVVPNQNEQVEFNHNQEVQRQLADLQGAVGSTPTAGGARTVVVESSTGYPARTIFVNPPRATGRLRTFGTGNPAFTIEVENAVATGETGDFWDGTTTQTYRSGGFVFDPNYNVYTEAPRTVVSNSLVYNQFPNGEDIVVNSQSLFDGRRISLVAMNGSYDEQGGAASVTVRPVSASSTRVSVEGTSSNPVTISIGTRLGDSAADAATRWEAILTEAGEMSGSGGYVDAVNPVGPVPGANAYRVEFVMDPSVTYSLSLAKAGVGTNVNAEPAERYVTTASAKNVSTTAGAKETLVVEVRDEFNNPLSGVEMDARVEWASGDEGSIVEPNGTETGEDGRVGFTYEAPDAKTDARVNVSISNAAGKSASVTFNVSVSKASGGGGGNGAYNVTLVNVADTNTPAGAVNCPNWPTNRTCIVDGSQLSTVNVTMGTSPTAVGASVSWAVNDTAVATVDPDSGRTQGNGENSTDVTLNANGDVVVFASSGAGGNRTTLRVTNAGTGPSDTTPPTLDSIQVDAIEQGNSGKLKSLSWTYTASDSGGSGFKDVTLNASNPSGSPELVKFTWTRSSATFTNSSGWNNYKNPAEITVTLRDNAGNVRTCKATISSYPGSVSRGDFTCSPVPQVVSGATGSVYSQSIRESAFNLSLVRERTLIAVVRGD